MKSEPQTRVAVLGTLAEFHQEPIPYDLNALLRLVTDLHPDLLCLDMTPEQWQQADFGGLPPEYREALLPLAFQSDIVVAPIAKGDIPAELKKSGWQGLCIRVLRAGLVLLQRSAPGPDAVNHGVRHDLANVLYHLISILSGGESDQQHEAHIDDLTQNALEVAHNNPGSRILIVVNVQYCHHIRPALAQFPDIEVVIYSEL